MENNIFERHNRSNVFPGQAASNRDNKTTRKTSSSSAIRIDEPLHDPATLSISKRQIVGKLSWFRFILSLMQKHRDPVMKTIKDWAEFCFWYTIIRGFELVIEHSVNKYLGLDIAHVVFLFTMLAIALAVFVFLAFYFLPVITKKEDDDQKSGGDDPDEFGPKKLIHEALKQQGETLEQQGKTLEQQGKILKQILDVLVPSATPAIDSKKFTEEAKAAPKVQIKYVEVEDFGDSLVEKLNNLFAETVTKLYPTFSLPVIVKETGQAKFGDYQFDMSSFIAHQVSAEQSIKVTPEEVAKFVMENLPKIPLIETVEIVRSSVNIFISKEHVCSKIAGIFSNGVMIPKVAKKKVVLDFSSPNIAKQMHVGHLRSTIIGESLARLMEYMGFSVLRLNHVGDWGTQFGMLIAHLQDEFPNYLNEAPPIQDLQEFYKESEKRFDEDESFKKRAYQCVVKLQSSESDIVKAWNQICDVSRRDFEMIYERLGVTLKERGESFYQSRMVRIVEELTKANVLKEEEGRKLFFPHGCTIPLTVVKSDGGFTYDTSDLATLKNRLYEENGDWLLYVVDRGQSEHFETIYAAGRDMGWYDPKEKRVEHVQFGLVLGEVKKKFKTRFGDTIRLTDLLDEGLRRAEAKLRDKGRKEELTAEQFDAARKSVAYGCAKYADLSHARSSDYAFSYDKMLEDRGNTAVYLLFAYAQIRAISRNAEISRGQIEVYVNGLKDVLPLSEPQELRLAKQILKFSDCLLNTLDDLMPHKLCDYIYSLATTFHDFYEDCEVIQKNAEIGATTNHYHRLVLCEVTADVMHQCFKILGINALEKI